MIRNAIICAALSLGVLAAAPAVSQADDFSPKVLCVDQSFPVVPAGCDNVWEYTRDGLASAVSYANFVTTFRGDDTIRIAAGTITIDGPAESIVYTAQPDFGALHIVGAGRGQTTLSGAYTLGSPGPVFNLVEMNVSAALSSSISQLSITTGPVSTTTNGLAINGGTVDDVEFTAYGDLDFTRRGLVTTGSGVTVKNSEFHAGGTNNGYGIYNIGHQLNVNDTTFEHAVQAFEDDQYGIYSTGTLIAKRLKFIGEETGIRFGGAQLEVYDSLFDMGAAESAVTITPELSGGSFLLQGITVVGSAPNQAGVKLVGSIHPMAGDVRESLFALTGAGSTEISCANAGGGAVNQLYIFHSMYATTAGDCLMPSAGNVIRSGTLQPAFVNAGAGDYRPAAGSPVIDAGSPVAFRPFDPKLDLGGLQRFVDGNGDGSAITDIGAYEFQPTAPGSGSGDGGATAPPLSIKFGKSVGKFKVKKTKPKTFTFTTAKKKPRLPVTSNLATPVELSLARSKAGWLSGTKCKSKKPLSGKRKRCDIPLKGKLALKLPAGTSYLTFSGGWNKKNLKPGKYALTLRAQGNKDSIKSVLNVIR
jgi:hypothetical protein